MILWILKTLHHWFGVVFAAFFFVVSLSGSWLVLDKYVISPEMPEAFQGQIEDLTRVREIAFIDEILQRYPIDNLSRIEFPVRERAVFDLTLRDGQSAYLGPKTLELIDVPAPGAITQFMTRLHKNLLNPWSIGHEIVIWTGLIAIFLSVLGLIIFVPVRRSFRKNRVLLPRELTFKDVRRTHLSSGLVFSAFIIFFGVTGWIIGEPEDAKAILSASNNTSIQFSERSAILAPSEKVSGIVGEALSSFPNQRLAVIDFAKEEQKQVLYLFTKTPNDFSLSGNRQIKIELQSGGTRIISLGDGKSLASQTLDNVYSLHTGDGRSLLYKLMISILGVAVSIVSLMGLLSYALKWRMKAIRALARRRKRNAPRQESSE